MKKLLKTDQRFKLEPLKQEDSLAFETIVQSLTETPVLTLPRKELHYSVDTDASDYQVGCALFPNHQDMKRKPIVYWSPAITQAERKYLVTEKE